MEKNKQELIKLPAGENKLLSELVERVNSSERLNVMWEVVNTNAMQRMGFSDHGPIHFKIVANMSLKILRVLRKAGAEAAIVRDYKLSWDYAELVVVLGSLLHDLGMTINRNNHEEYSLFLANRVMEELLEFLPLRERVIVASEALHTIISHRSDGKPTTIEAGIVRVADALDMSEGRSRIPFEKGEVNIHSLSAYAINSVEIIEGNDDTPLDIHIYMNNSSGLFQVDELLKEKLIGSGLEKYVQVKAFVEGETEKKLISEFVIKR